MPTAPDVVTQVTALKAEMEKAVALRAQASAQLDVAKRELARIDAELRSLGVNPELAADELRVLEEQLALTTSELSAQIEIELNAYRGILGTARP